MYEDTTTLLKRIALGEDSVLELKSVQVAGEKVVAPHRNGMADELAAMANTASGIVVLGVDDKTREILGIPAHHLDVVERWVRSICNDSIDPPLDCVIRKLAVPTGGDERFVVRIDVPRSLFVHKSPNGYFRRIGSSRREMKPEALARLFQQRSQVRLIRFDEQIVPGTTLETLDPALWRKFRTVLSPREDVEFL
jgi:ATP-dependent DNA helicase RecG